MKESLKGYDDGLSQIPDPTVSALSPQPSPFGLMQGAREVSLEGYDSGLS